MSEPEQLVELAEFVKTDPKLQYEALVDVSSVDRSQLPIGDDRRFHTVYQLRSYTRKQHLMVVCPLAGQRRTRRAQPGRRLQGRHLARARSVRPDGHPLRRPS